MGMQRLNARSARRIARVSAGDEVRSAGISCPSCGLNLADTMKASHRLALAAGNGPGPGYAECRDGQPADLSDLAAARAAYNVVAAEGWLLGSLVQPG